MITIFLDVMLSILTGIFLTLFVLDFRATNTVPVIGAMTASVIRLVLELYFMTAIPVFYPVLTLLGFFGTLAALIVMYRKQKSQARP